MKAILALAALLLPVASPAAPVVVSKRPSLQQLVETRLAEAGPGPRFGLVVATLEGEELVRIRPDERFIPASNAKVLTTAAAFANQASLGAQGSGGGALLRLEPRRSGPPDLILEGRADAALSSAPDCRFTCLAALADTVAAKTRRVHDVIGDDRFLPDERWSQGMSWNNIPTVSGTAMSALTLDGNEFVLRVAPGELGKPPVIDATSYFTIDNAAVTVTEGTTNLSAERLPGSRRLRLTGTIAIASEPRSLRLGIDDPAHFAAWRLRVLLEQRGVRVTGETLSRHRVPPPTTRVGFGSQQPFATLAPAPLSATLRTTNKLSQNLHAELLLRRLGLKQGDGSAEAGIEEVRAMMQQAGVPDRAWHLADGSGMSTYNRLSPRGITTLLRWIAGQPWGAAFRETLPVGGVDGTLARRFHEGPLRGRIVAKTGSLNATNALAGYLLTRSGRTLVFAFYANDVPPDVRATAIMDRTLEEIAERH